MQQGIRTSSLGAKSPGRYREGPQRDIVESVARPPAVDTEGEPRGSVLRMRRHRRPEEAREGMKQERTSRRSWVKPAAVSVAVSEPIELRSRKEASKAAPIARPKDALPVPRKGLLDVLPALQRRYACIDYLEAKGTALRPGCFITADVDGDEVVVGAMVVEALFVHPDNRQAFKLRPVVALGTWKKFQDVEFRVNSSTLLYGVPMGYRGKQMRLFEEFFRILEHCRYGLTPVEDRGKPKRQRYTHHAVGRRPTRL